MYKCATWAIILSIFIFITITVIDTTERPVHHRPRRVRVPPPTNPPSPTLAWRSRATLSRPSRRRCWPWRRCPPRMRRRSPPSTWRRPPTPRTTTSSGAATWRAGSWTTPARGHEQQQATFSIEAISRLSACPQVALSAAVLDPDCAWRTLVCGEDEKDFFSLSDWTVGVSNYSLIAPQWRHWKNWNLYWSHSEDIHRSHVLLGSDKMRL